jgi:hypothetical protein
LVPAFVFQLIIVRRGRSFYLSPRFIFLLVVELFLIRLEVEVIRKQPTYKQPNRIVADERNATQQKLHHRTKACTTKKGKLLMISRSNYGSISATRRKISGGQQVNCFN